MIRQLDLHTEFVESALTTTDSTTGTTTAWGKAVLTYEVAVYVDTRNLAQRRSYVVTSTQRVVVVNQKPPKIGPVTATSAFKNYPAAIMAAIVPSQHGGTGQAAQIRLLDYSPRTINAAVQSSLANTAQSGTSVSQQHSAGSSVSQTNSYSLSASVGVGQFLSGGGERGKSTTVSESVENSVGRSSDRQQGTDESASMSIKDWASYAWLDSTGISPTWIWGQEFPWDVVQYNTLAGGTIQLPSFVKSRLFDTDANLLLPPSQLALFGFDFTMKAQWQVIPDYAGGDADCDLVDVASTGQLVTASHEATGATPPNPPFTATLTQAMSFDALPTQSLDLCWLALDRVEHAQAGNGAVIAFAPNRFLQPPGPGATFKIVSGSNNLLVTGTGFSAGMSTAAGQAASVHVGFKITDVSEEYHLLLKHWTDSTDGVTLTITVNGDKANQVVRYVNEGEGGEDNIMSLSLRNNDFASVDYHDYLLLGANLIDVDVAPMKSSGSDAVYHLQALGIGAV